MIVWIRALSLRDSEVHDWLASIHDRDLAF